MLLSNLIEVEVEVKNWNCIKILSKQTNIKIIPVSLRNFVLSGPPSKISVSSFMLNDGLFLSLVKSGFAVANPIDEPAVSILSIT